MGKKAIIAIIIVAILAVAIPLTVQLAQRQQQLKSKAATPCDQQAYDGQTFSSQGESVVSSFQGAYGEGAEAEWIRQHNSQLAQNPPRASDNQTLFDQACAVIYSFYSTSGSSAPQTWVQQHNAAISGGGAQPPPQGGTCREGNCNACTKMKPCPGQNVETYNVCEDENGLRFGAQTFCKDPSKPNQKFRCFSSETGVCSSNPSGGFAYSCNECGLGLPPPAPPPETQSPPPQGGNPPAGGASRGSSCEYRILNAQGADVTGGPVYENDPYVLRITMTNKGGTIWDKSTHKLQALNNTILDWATLGVYPLPRDQVNKNESVLFNIDTVAKPIPTGKLFEDRSFSFSMADSQGIFGASCTPQIVRIQKKDASLVPTSPPSPTTPPGLVTTSCYVMSENVSDVTSVTSCDFTNPLVKAYDEHPKILTYNLADQTPGQKTIYVKFFDNLGRASNNGVPYAKSLILAPDPTIANLDCHHNPTAEGTQVIITGSNFGANQGKGRVKVGDSNRTAKSWTDSSIAVDIDQRLEGNVNVSVTTDEGRSVDRSCTINITSVSFSARQQCRLPGQFSASDMDVRIFEQGPDPILRQKISLDRNGITQGFTPKLEKDKDYTMIIKAPGSLAKRVFFKTKGGTVTLDPITLAVGDIAPAGAPDGKVNALDASEVKREWVLTQDVERDADFNKDRRVNSLDYSCLLRNINQEDEGFVKPTSQSTPAPSGSAQTRNLRLSGRVFRDDNLDVVLNPGEQTISGANIKLLHVPDNHVLGLRLTAQELAASTLLGQAASTTDGSYSLNATAPANILKMSLVIDPSQTTANGSQVDIGIGAFPATFEQFSINLPVEPPIP